MLDQAVETFWAYRKTRGDGQSARSLHLRNRLILANQGLARKIAHRWSGQCSESCKDLEQFALIGLSKAVERFDPAMGKAFSSFAVPYIRGEILHFLRDSGTLIKVPRKAREMVASVRRDRQRLLALGRDCTEEEVATAKGFSAAKWRQAKEAVSFRPIENLDEFRHLSGETAESRIDLHSALHQELAKLSKLHRTCLVEFFFKGLGEESIARKLQVTSEQVHAWIEEGLDKLKNTKLAEILH